MNKTPVDDKLPVFVFPHILNFYLDNPKSLKQVLTIYNPYDSTILFKVLSTAPRKYAVVDPEGQIKPKSCVDIVVRHVAPSLTSCNIEDKFRIQITEFRNSTIFGKKDVPAILHKESDTGVLQADSDLGMDDFRLTKSEFVTESVTKDQRIDARSSPNYLALLVAAICVAALMLPTTGDADTQLPTYLHLTLHQKLVFAYTLGLMTMVVLNH
ncbi:motile sperm domain-containing protein 1-like [Artemia franciscana]|uniref:MSP domain-containing protein n=1 Tax=Artemia franciscana TaxID=6661 RepID=A0AA88KRW8_ARTSF|nr:hypothetical protein QYM36_017900 [Artemia franciscana]